MENLINTIKSNSKSIIDFILRNSVWIAAVLISIYLLGLQSQYVKALILSAGFIYFLTGIAGTILFIYTKINFTKKLNEGENGKLDATERYAIVGLAGKIFQGVLIAGAIILGIIYLSMFAQAQTSYELPATKEALEKSRAVLFECVGIKEVGGNNKGKDINRILSPLGLKEVAWCQALQYYCFWVTGEPIPIAKTAGSQACFNDAKKRGKQIPYQVKIDALLIYRTINSWTGHSTRVVALGRMGWITTIEGNTGSGNQRDGDGCYKKKRHIYNPIGKLRVLGSIVFKVA
jgi:hypothetical protein